jgi:hypothetical protein
MVTNSVIISDTTTTAVAAGLLTLEDGRILADRTDPKTSNNLMALTISVLPLFLTWDNICMLEIMKFERCALKLPFYNSCSKTTRRK